MSRRSVVKGKVWEREVARRLRTAMPGCEARRGLSQSRGGGAEESDVVVPCFHVEAKHHAVVNVGAALAQACEDAGPGLYPIAVCKSDRRPPMVAMRLDDFEALVAEWWERGKR